MNKFTQSIIKSIGDTAAVIGAAIVSWQVVAMYYLISGRIQPGDDQPPIVVVAILLVIGMFLLMVGYMARKFLLANSVTDTNSVEEKVDGVN